MEQAALEVEVSQSGVYFFRTLDGLAVDDAWVAAEPFGGHVGDEVLGGPSGGAGAHFVVEVGAVGGGLEVVAVGDLEAVDQVFARLRRHGGGHAEDSDPAEHRADFAEPRIVRSEVSTPFAHAMSLVDHDQLYEFLDA